MSVIMPHPVDHTVLGERPPKRSPPSLARGLFAGINAVINSLRLFFFLAVFLTDVVGMFIVHAVLSLGLKWISPRGYRRVQCFFESLFARIMLSLVHFIAGGNIYLHLPAIDDPAHGSTLAKFQGIFENLHAPPAFPATEDDILISNHQIYSDWVYLWSLMDVFGRAGDVKIIMKRSLRAVPVFGWAMRFFNFVFLRRKWEHDRAHFHKRLRTFGDSDFSFCLIIFPEGTTLTKASLAKSHAFAQKSEARETQHVLLPRVLGVWEAIKGLQMAERVDGIYDITVGYSGLAADDEPERVFTLPNLFYRGMAPKETHFHLTYIPIKEIPTENIEDFSQWLRDRFYRKDEMLKVFYERNGTATFNDVNIEAPFPNTSRSMKRPLCPFWYFPMALAIFCVSCYSFYLYYRLLVNIVRGIFIAFT